MNPLQIEELEQLEEQYFDGSLEGMSREEISQRFKIDNLDSLNWAFRKIAAYQAKLKEVQSLVNTERDRIDRWEKAQSSGIQQSIDFFSQLAADYHAKVLEENPKSKTLSTPYGKSKSTTSKAQPDQQNEEQIIKFVEENKLPFVEKVPKLKWAELKKTLKVVEKDGEQIIVNENGQVVPGVAVKPQTTTFKVEI